MSVRPLRGSADEQMTVGLGWVVLTALGVVLTFFGVLGRWGAFTALLVVGGELVTLTLGSFALLMWVLVAATRLRSERLAADNRPELRELLEEIRAAMSTRPATGRGTRKESP